MNKKTADKIFQAIALLVLTGVTLTLLMSVKGGKNPYITEMGDYDNVYKYLPEISEEDMYEE